MLSLLKLQGSGALPAAVNQRIEAARNQGPDGKILALRAGLIAVPQEVRDRCLGELPSPLAALAAASVHMPEESVVGAVAVIAPLVTLSAGPLNPADLLPVIGSLQATLHSMPPAARRAAAELPPTQGAMLTAVARMEAADVAAMVTIVQPAACNPEDSESTRAQPSESAAAAPSGLRLGETAVSDEALGAVHRLLVALPASARAELAEALPAPVQPLVGMAADMDAEEFKQARSQPPPSLPPTPPLPPPSLPPTPSPLAVHGCCLNCPARSNLYLCLYLCSPPVRHLCAPPHASGDGLRPRGGRGDGGGDGAAAPPAAQGVGDGPRPRGEAGGTNPNPNPSPNPNLHSNPNPGPNSNSNPNPNPTPNPNPNPNRRGWRVRSPARRGWWRGARH